ncbi:glycosyltransferase family 2 protein [Halomonas sp.]|uniref:glycosyltransferase family 2 protein n=1 Tax=Halomonas sp. TaxID=1486246 RepID=UPI0038507904
MTFDVDILLATWNGERFLPAQLQSLLDQEYTHWRLLAHDDGSSDSTRDILRAFQSEHPERVKFFDDGVKFGSARDNFAYLLSHATAPYVMFCDQDDIWLPFKISLTREIMRLEETQKEGVPILVHSDLVVVNATGDILSSSFLASQRLPHAQSLLDAIVLNSVTGCTVMLNRAAVDAGSPIPSQAIMHDWWLACRTLQCDGIVRLIELPTMHYRQHGGNAVGSKAIGLQFYLRRFASLPDVLSSMLAVIKQARALEVEYSTAVIVCAKLRHTLKRITKSGAGS